MHIWVGIQMEQTENLDPLQSLYYAIYPSSVEAGRYALYVSQHDHRSNFLSWMTSCSSPSPRLEQIFLLSRQYTHMISSVMGMAAT